MKSLTKSIASLALVVAMCEGCQSPGNSICYLGEYDVPVGEPCCAGSLCLPWFGDKSKFVDNFCQFSNPIQDGGFCGNRVGQCATGLSCINNMCSPGTATTTTTTTTSTTTTTEAGSGCQQPGNTLCYMSEYDIPVRDPCCAGSMCLPWFGEYGKAVDNFCQLSNPIQEGKFCGNRVGQCDTGLSCINNVCSASIADCQEPGNAICYSGEYGLDVGEPCCSGSFCRDWNTGDAIVDKFCQFTNPIQDGIFCGNKTGDCDFGLKCINNACSTSTSDSVCQDPGYALCSIPGVDYDFQPCCEGSECKVSIDDSYSYCQSTQPIPEGGSCGNKEGACSSGTSCKNGICTDGSACGPLGTTCGLTLPACCKGSMCLVDPNTGNSAICK